MKNQLLLLFMLILFFAKVTQAQTPSDAIMMKQGEICVALIYENSWFDEYWEGTKLRTNGTIATVKRNTVMPMVAIGIFDRLNLIVGAPWTQTQSTEPNGGFFQGAKGFQDISFNLKGVILKKQLGKGKLAFLANAGFATPMTNYLSDYRPYSLGNGTNELSFRGILQYELDNGLYLRGAGAYVWRGQTESERDYYYNNGSYYTAWMDVPSAWNFHAVAGMWLLDYSLKVEANYIGLKSTTGDDIRPYNAAQPTNMVNFHRLGFGAQYYFKNLKGLGVLAYFNHTINGRNVGKESIITAGLTYQFNIFKKQDDEPADRDF